MGNKGNNRHIKRLASPRYMHVAKKVDAYIIKPNAGRHTRTTSIALSTVLKEKLGMVGSSKEARNVIRRGNVEVNGKVIKDERFPVGFGDVIKPKSGNETYLISVGNRGMMSIDKRGSESKQVLKVVGKYISKGNKEMIRLYNGVVMQSPGNVHVNDSVVIGNGKVDKVIKLEAGAKCLIVKGVHASDTGTISAIKPGTALRDATVEIKGKSGTAETLLDNVMVIGD